MKPKLTVQDMWKEHVKTCPTCRESAKTVWESELRRVTRKITESEDLEGKALKRLRSDEDEAGQGEVVEVASYSKESVNYRYASDPSRACATCIHFIKPGACELVEGMIRSVDVCDLWKGSREAAKKREAQRLGRRLLARLIEVRRLTQSPAVGLFFKNYKGGK